MEGEKENCYSRCLHLEQMKDEQKEAKICLEYLHIMEQETEVCQQIEQ